MIAFLVRAAKIGIMLMIVVKKTGFTTNRTTRIRIFKFRPIRRKLMIAFTALIFLIT